MKMSPWSKFWNWYSNKILGSVIIVAFIQTIQIPHMFWNADLYFETGYLSRINPIYDFIFYGIDLIEIVSIINIWMVIYSIMRKKR